jgi:predicted nicotinamide N-methyase
MGAGGGVSCLAAARAGARRVVACDVDPWALAVTRLAARRQNLSVEVLQEDPSLSPARLDGFDVVLCADLAYDRSTAARERAALQHAARNGAHLLLADAGRTWFDASGLTGIAEFVIPTVADLEGRTQALTRVFERCTV